MHKEAAKKIDAGLRAALAGQRPRLRFEPETLGRRPGTLAVAAVAAASIDTQLRAQLRE